MPTRMNPILYNKYSYSLCYKGATGEGDDGNDDDDTGCC